MPIATYNTFSEDGLEALFNLIKAIRDKNVAITTDESLTLDPETGVLSVNTTDMVEEDNTLPVTSSAVYSVVGNIEALLKTI